MYVHGIFSLKTGDL